MIEGKILILIKQDLNGCKKHNFKKLTKNDFIVSSHKIMNADLVIYKDKEKIQVLKSRNYCFDWLTIEKEQFDKS